MQQNKVRIGRVCDSIVGSTSSTVSLHANEDIGNDRPRGILIFTADFIRGSFSESYRE